MTEPMPDFTDFHDVMGIDRVIHEPARLLLLALLSKVEWADFKFLLTASGLTKGNLSRQAAKLEEVGYIEIAKSFQGKIPVTRYRVTERGKTALALYWKQMSALRDNLNASS